MAKLYIFGIGGTGSRVLKSLTMLMATGVKVEDNAGNPYEIVPIVIDPDHAAADLTRTVKLMQDYVKIQNAISHNNCNKNNFFGMKINMDIIQSVCMPLENTLDIDFKEYIGLQNMKDVNNKPNANYALASILFSEKNLDAKMDVGFKGNPNIGTVVLNQFTRTAEWDNFIASFAQDDKIFIISSIFGGTGASGFPLLLKNIRAVDDNKSGCANVKNSIIGAVTVMPYFDVKPNEDSEIDSSTFISKTKAALSYYERNVNEVNALYYIGDRISKQYENSEGGSTQQNSAHFIELAAALAIVDFASQGDLSTSDGIPSKTIYKEFGIRNESTELIFSDLDGDTNDTIKKPLIEFTLFCKYMNEQLRDSLDQPWAKDLKYDRNFIRSSFYNTYLCDFKNAYMEWLEEMNNNTRAFTPFNLIENKNDLFSFVKGEKPAPVFSIDSNYALFDRYLNKKSSKISRDSSKENIFMELFYMAIDELVHDKYRL